jgi:hypothetical protein
MKKTALLGLMGMALAMQASTQDFEITERGNTGTGKKPGPKKSSEPTPFNKQEGVLNMIQDYNLIKKGESKKGIIKQSRIKNKVDEWLKSGMLKEEDLLTTKTD